MNIKEAITGGIVTVVIGTTAFSISQEDVTKNFAEDSGMTQEQAEEYVNNIPEDELVGFSELGDSYISRGEEVLAYAEEFDCETYDYGWESATLSCQDGKEQLSLHGKATVEVGEAYKKLNLDSAGKPEVTVGISALDELIKTYNLEIIQLIFEPDFLSEYKNTDIYNKSLLKTTLVEM